MFYFLNELKNWPGRPTILFGSRISVRQVGLGGGQKPKKFVSTTEIRLKRLCHEIIQLTQQAPIKDNALWLPDTTASLNDVGTVRSQRDLSSKVGKIKVQSFRWQTCP